MPAARPALAAERRTIIGKKVAHLRHDGRLPAVVYGHGVDSEPGAYEIEGAGAGQCG